MAHHHTNRPFKEKLKDVLALNSSERRGMALLMGLCLLAAAWVAYEELIHPRPEEDKAVLQAAWEPMAASIASDTNGRQRSDHQSDRRAPVLFHFDPNGLPVEQWMELGLTGRQAEAIHRYEARGGRFRSKKDLARMRVVDPGLFAQWAPYIDLPDSIARGPWTMRDEPEGLTGHRGMERSEAVRPVPAPRRASVVEVNGADSVSLVALPGIGPSFARGILRYREMLGGYMDLDQMAEVYVLRDKPDAVERLRQMLLVDTTLVRRINLNTMEADPIGRHPYGGWKLAKALVAYRKQHGPFKSVEGIRACALVTDSIYLRLSPYLLVE